MYASTVFAAFAAAAVTVAAVPAPAQDQYRYAGGIWFYNDGDKQLLAIQQGKQDYDLTRFAGVKDIVWSSAETVLGDGITDKYACTLIGSAGFSKNIAIPQAKFDIDPPQTVKEIKCNIA